jgi:D-amino-acid oxidase
MTTVPPEVLVLGAGVSGLTTAVCLAESGFDVRIRTRELPHGTTSCAAGAIWSPYLVSHPNIDEWGARTMEVLAKLAGDRGTGVRMVTGTEAGRSPVDPPGWATRVADYRQCGADELLSYLAQRLTQAGGRIEVDPAASLDDAWIAVNCTGFGARDLVPDLAIEPVRGQLVVAENPGVEEFFAEHTGEFSAPTYFLPHGEHIVLGGSAEPGRIDMHPDLETSAAIVDRCAEIEPRLRRARITGHRVGIRPTRPTVRVEHVRRRGRHVIHNYGHGGAGVSLSWGCASEVTGIVADLYGG